MGVCPETTLAAVKRCGWAAGAAAAPGLAGDGFGA